MLVRLSVAVAALASLAGCATSSQTYGPDGRVAHTINCSGMAQTWGACFAKAGELCGTAGYDVLAQGADQSMILGGGPYSFAGSSTQNRSLLISCKPPHG
jgi:hypothetical protein